MAKGIRVSPTGVNVQKVAIKDLLYTTEAQSLKIRDHGIVTFNFSTNATTTATVHFSTLPFAPAYRVFCEVVPGSGQWFADAYSPGGIDVNPDPPNAATFLSQVSKSTLQIIVVGVAGNLYQAKYFIFEDQLL